MRLIESYRKGGGNCRELAQGAIECVLPGKDGYSETLRSGDEGLAGLSMPLRPSESGRYRWARNAMAYGSMSIPRRLSASQLAMIRVYLQHPLMIGDEALRRLGRLPEGMNAAPSYRTTLGLPDDDDE